MDTSTDLPDPTDWLSTPLKDFAPLENALHCDICKEFYDTPMLTSCCHTFCSKCIRTCLSANGKCPSCQTAEQASKLRNNWIVQTLVEQFLAARPAALEVARREGRLAEEEQARLKKKRKRVVLDSDDLVMAEGDGRTTRSKSRRITASQTSEPEPETIEVEDSDGEFEPEEAPEADDGLVDCLFGCGKRIKPEEMDAHLDRCEREKLERQQREAQRSKSRTPVSSLTSRPPSTQALPERIAEFNYSLLNDTKLRQKISSLGIPNWGSRQLMIKRHTEWVNLWNANCDSGGRKTQRELLRELDAWERTQGGRAPNPSGLSSTIMRKDFDGVGWASTNKSDFSRLIADATRKKPNISTDESKTKDDSAVAEEPRNDDKTTLLQHASAQPSPPAQSLVPVAPYENNPEAISSIREKVQAANEGRHIEPKLNADFGLPPATANGNVTMDVEDSEHLPHFRGPSRDEHVVHTTTAAACDLPVHIHSSPVKRVPMFEMPRQPVSDVDQGGGGG